VVAPNVWNSLPIEIHNTGSFFPLLTTN